MTKFGNLRTDATAYLALLAGAGLSIAGNVADTYRTRGQDTDALDIVMAVGWPALVVLMVHMFVSTRWVGLSWPVQVMRWLGTLTIGGIAMRASWVHLNDLMLHRDQKADVSALGPVAIDCLAIMATALLLAGRRVSSVQDKDKDITTAADVTAAWTQDVHKATSIPDMADGQDWTDHGPSGPWAKLTKTSVPSMPTAQWADPGNTPDLDTNWTPEDADWLSRLGRELDSTTTPAVPVVAGTLPTRRRQAVRGVVDELEALELAEIGRLNGLGAGEIAALLAGWYGVSTRTVRRIPGWKEAAA